MTTSFTQLFSLLAKKLLSLPLLRLVLIAILNFLFISKTFKRFFEKIIFNPYFIPSVKEQQIKAQAKALLSVLGDVQNKVFLELGPGGDCLLACHLLKAGARQVTLLDVENYIHIPKTERVKYQSIFPEALDTEGNLNSTRIVLLSYRNDGSIPLAHESIDCVYSQAVFEHVTDPMQLVQETHRVLKPGGKSYHQIDFRDHVFQQSSLLFLLFSKRTFHTLFSRTGMWANRLRFSEWKNIFSQNGFQISQIKTTTVPYEHLAPSHIKKLKHLSKEDLITTGASFFLIK